MQEQQSITTENRTIRERLEDLVSPELEYLLGAFGMYVDLAILVSIQRVPMLKAWAKVFLIPKLRGGK